MKILFIIIGIIILLLVGVSVLMLYLWYHDV